MEAFAKISSKGQVTIPKIIREKLKSDIICFKVKNGEIIIESVKDVGGSLKKYASKKISHEKEREIAWSKIANEYNKIS